MKIRSNDLSLRLSALAASAIVTGAILAGIDRLAQPETDVAADLVAAVTVGTGQSAHHGAGVGDHRTIIAFKQVGGRQTSRDPGTVCVGGPAAAADAFSIHVLGGPVSFQFTGDSKRRKV